MLLPCELNLNQYDELVIDPSVKFGENLSHMMEINWNNQNGWQNGTIKKFNSFENIIYPHLSTFYNAMSIAECLEITLDEHGNALLFRPTKQFDRLNNKCENLFFPSIDIEETMQCLYDFIRSDIGYIKENLNRNKDNNCNIRCFINVVMIAMDGCLPPHEIKLYCFTNVIRNSNININENRKNNTNNNNNNTGNTIISNVLNLDAFNDKYGPVRSDNTFIVIENNNGSQNKRQNKNDNENEIKDKEIIVTQSGCKDECLIIIDVFKDCIVKMLDKKRDEFEVDSIKNNKQLLISDLLDYYEQGNVIEIFQTHPIEIITPVTSILYDQEFIPIVPKHTIISQTLKKEIYDIKHGIQKHPWGVTVPLMWANNAKHY